MGPRAHSLIARTKAITQKRESDQTVPISPAKWWINVYVSLGLETRARQGLRQSWQGRDDGRSSLAPAAASAQEPCHGAKRHMHTPHAIN